MRGTRRLALIIAWPSIFTSPVTRYARRSIEVQMYWPVDVARMFLLAFDARVSPPVADVLLPSRLTKRHDDEIRCFLRARTPAAVLLLRQLLAASSPIYVARRAR